MNRERIPAAEYGKFFQHFEPDLYDPGNGPVRPRTPA